MLVDSVFGKEIHKNACVLLVSNTQDHVLQLLLQILLFGK